MEENDFTKRVFCKKRGAQRRPVGFYLTHLEGLKILLPTIDQQVHVKYPHAIQTPLSVAARLTYQAGNLL